MNIDLSRLNNDVDKYLTIESDINLSDYDLASVELLDLKDVHASGRIFKNGLGNYQMVLHVTGIMVLSCAITLKPVEHKFEFDIDEEIEEYLKNNENVKNSLDILPIIWENILMEIPMKVVCDDVSDVKLEGDGWKLITKEDENKVNPELAKLKDLL